MSGVFPLCIEVIFSNLKFFQRAEECLQTFDLGYKIVKVTLDSKFYLFIIEKVKWFSRSSFNIQTCLWNDTGSRLWWNKPDRKGSSWIFLATSLKICIEKFGDQRCTSFVRWFECWKQFQNILSTILISKSQSYQLQFFLLRIVCGIHQFISNFKVKLWQLYSIKGRDLLLFQELIDVLGKNTNSEQFDSLTLIYV